MHIVILSNDVYKLKCVYLSKVDSLKAALNYVRNENTRIKGEKLKVGEIYLTKEILNEKTY